ncbi:MAG: hypothetical protein MZU95_14655 [Desulfomicrobium escambiense]|nr:hypothetical protein [Desulfomicrobium escambiense]
MDAPLGRAVGNAIEVVEAIETLRGQGPQDLTELSVILAARMVADGRAGGRRLDDGRAAGARGAGVGRGRSDRFRRMVARQGGDPRVVDDPSRLAAGARPRAGACAAGRVRRPASTPMLIGRAAAALGAGRATADDRVDHGVGIRGAGVARGAGAGGRAGARTHSPRREGPAATPPRSAVQAIELGGAPPAPQPLVVGDGGADRARESTNGCDTWMTTELEARVAASGVCSPAGADGRARRRRVALVADPAGAASAACRKAQPVAGAGADPRDRATCCRPTAARST